MYLFLSGSILFLYKRQATCSVGFTFKQNDCNPRVWIRYHASGINNTTIEEIMMCLEIQGVAQLQYNAVWACNYNWYRDKLLFVSYVHPDLEYFMALALILIIINCWISHVSVKVILDLTGTLYFAVNWVLK